MKQTKEYVLITVLTILLGLATLSFTQRFVATITEAGHEVMRQFNWVSSH
jgi:hypothetical protein